MTSQACPIGVTCILILQKMSFLNKASTDVIADKYILINLIFKQTYFERWLVINTSQN